MLGSGELGWGDVGVGFWMGLVVGMVVGFGLESIVDWSIGYGIRGIDRY